MYYKEIVLPIYKILEDKFGVDAACLTEENDRQPLTGNCFRLSGIQLTYPFFEIERYFDVSMDASLALNYGFNTISKIAGIVDSALGNGG